MQKNNKGGKSEGIIVKTSIQVTIMLQATRKEEKNLGCQQNVHSECFPRNN